jgi:hypothetical protein
MEFALIQSIVGIELVADLNTSDPLYEDLLSHGCIVGMSSYRKQGSKCNLFVRRFLSKTPIIGLVVRHAMTDVDNLTRLARKQFFPQTDNIQPAK